MGDSRGVGQRERGSGGKKSCKRHLDFSTLNTGQAIRSNSGDNLNPNENIRQSDEQTRWKTPCHFGPQHELLSGEVRRQPRELENEPRHQPPSFHSLATLAGYFFYWLKDDSERCKHESGSLAWGFPLIQSSLRSNVDITRELQRQYPYNQHLGLHYGTLTTRSPLASLCVHFSKGTGNSSSPCRKATEIWETRTTSGLSCKASPHPVGYGYQIGGGCGLIGWRVTAGAKLDAAGICRQSASSHSMFLTHNLHRHTS